MLGTMFLSNRMKTRSCITQLQNRPVVSYVAKTWLSRKYHKDSFWISEGQGDWEVKGKIK